MFNIKDEKGLNKLLEEQSDKKVSFAKITYRTGSFVVAFPDSLTKNYCECNSLGFKSLKINDIKTDDIPIWECGARTEKEINALPKLNIKKHLEKITKEKTKAKEAKVKKMIKTRQAKKSK